MGINEANPSSLSSPNINDPNLKPTLTDEITLGVEHALTANFATGLSVVWRNIHDIPESRLLIEDARASEAVAAANSPASADHLDSGEKSRL